MKLLPLSFADFMGYAGAASPSIFRTHALAPPIKTGKLKRTFILKNYGNTTHATMPLVKMWHYATSKVIGTIFHYNLPCFPEKKKEERKKV